MKKWILAILALSCCLAAAACAGKEDNTSRPPVPEKKIIRPAWLPSWPVRIMNIRMTARFIPRPMIL